MGLRVWAAPQALILGQLARGLHQSLKTVGVWVQAAQWYPIQKTPQEYWQWLPLLSEGLLGWVAEPWEPLSCRSWSLLVKKKSIY